MPLVPHVFPHPSARRIDHDLADRTPIEHRPERRDVSASVIASAPSTPTAGKLDGIARAGRRDDAVAQTREPDADLVLAGEALPRERRSREDVATTQNCPSRVARPG